MSTGDPQMKAASLLTAAFLVGATSAAFAQNAPQAAGPADHGSVQNQPADQRGDSSAANKGANKAGTPSDGSQDSVRQQMVNDLQQAGFTEVKIRPQSFLVEARDRSGNPVTMFVGPNTFAEVKTVGANAQKSSSSANASGNNANATTAGPGGAFTSVPAKDGLS